MLDALSLLTGLDIIDSESVSEGRHPSLIVTLASGEKRFVKQAPSQQIRTEQYVLCQLEKVTNSRARALFFPTAFELPKQTTQHEILVTSFIEAKEHSITQSAATKPAEIKSKQTNIDKAQLLAHQTNLVSALSQLHSFNISDFKQLQSWQFIPAQLPELSEMPLEQQSLVQHVLDQYKKALNTIESEALPQYIAVNHGDLCPGNLLLLGDRFAFIDWEYATIRDLRWDLATLSVEFQLSDAEYIKLCRRYVSFFFTSSSLNNSKAVDDFLEGALIWRDIYRFTSLQWSITNDQPIEKYLNQT